MKDLVKEGRELQDKVVKKIREADITPDSERVKETNEYEVVIPNSLDALKKMSNNRLINLDKVKPKTAFQIFSVVAKDKSTEADVEGFKSFTVISTEDGDYLAYDSNNSSVPFQKVLSATRLSKSTFQFGKNDGKVIVSKPEQAVDLTKALDSIYKQSAKDVSDFKRKVKQKIGLTTTRKIGLGKETFVRNDKELAVVIPNSIESLKHITNKDTFNHDIKMPKDEDTAYQIFIVVYKAGSKYYDSKQYKTITVYANANGTFDIFDNRDKKITIDELIKVTGLNRSLFRYGANEGEIFIHKADFTPKNTLDLLKHMFKNKKDDQNVVSRPFDTDKPKKKDGILTRIAKSLRGKSKQEMKEAPEDETEANPNQANQQPKQTANARIVLDNENVLVSIPRNFDYIRDVGADTKWMVVGGTFGGTEFDKYKKEKYTVYILQLKKESPNYSNRLLRKIAVLISPSNQITCYDVMDNLVDILKVMKVTNTQRSLYKRMI